MTFNKGAELDKQIYKEGESTWGCKSGVLDVEDVKEIIKIIKILTWKKYILDIEKHMEFSKEVNELVGEKLACLNTSTNGGKKNE